MDKKSQMIVRTLIQIEGRHCQDAGAYEVRLGAGKDNKKCQLAVKPKIHKLRAGVAKM